MTGSATRDLEARLDAPRIAVLGPVAIGEPAHLHAVAERPGRLLVALAAARRPLDADALSQVVWGDELPATYRSALHVHLSGLRRLLAAVAPDACRIARLGDGYRLERDGCELDAELASELVDLARAASVEDPQRAFALTDRALDLWRGPPFSVAGDIVDAAGWHRLEALRREAEELRIEALLDMGSPERAEVAAMEAVEAEPLREHRWGQLLRARYLAGRTGEALATYQEARSTLVDALGIEPGQELHDLEAAVLTHDAARLRHPATETAIFPGLPPSGGIFIGRRDEMARVTAAIAAGVHVAVLGPAGVGKSRFTSEVLKQLERTGVAWIDVCDGRPDPTAVAEWARAHPDDTVVLDNADADPVAARAVLEAVHGSSPTVTTVLTSRVPLTTHAVVEVLLPLETPATGAADDEVEATPAAQALRAALQELAPGSTVSTTDVAQLCRRAGGLPLVLRLSAAAVRAVPASTLAALPASVEGDAVDRATRSVLDVLPDDVRAAFLDLCVAGGDFGIELGERITAQPVGRFVDTVVPLVHHGLVQARPERVHPYRIPEPIRAAGLRLLNDSGRRAETMDRYVDACMEEGRAVQRLATDGHVDDLEDRLRTDLPRFQEVIEHLTHIDDAERALRLAARLDGGLYVVGWWREKTELLDAALRIGGPPSRSRARAHLFRSRPGPLHLIDVDHAEQAEEMATSLGAEALAANARLFRSLACWWSGDTAQAIALAEDACLVFAEQGRTFELCEARKFLGVALVLHGEATRGLELQRDALAVVRRELPNPFHIAHNLSYLGHCHRFLGDDTAALADWTTARDVCVRVGNRGTAIHVNIGLADVAVDRADPELALRRIADALELIGASGAQTYTSWAWTVAMRAHAALGDVESSLACARSAIDHLEAGPPGEATRLAVELALVALSADQPTSAARLFGFASASLDRRELPFPPPAERERRSAGEARVGELLGEDAARHLRAGPDCTIAEACGDLLTS